jgi:hypothetical protein
MPGQRGAIVRIAQSITAGCPDYSTREARRVFRGVPCISPRIPHRGHRRSMLTVKPANDTEEFHAAIERIEQSTMNASILESCQTTIANILY